MLFQIKQKFTGKVLFETNLPDEISVKKLQFQFNFALKEAVESGADLNGANLREADLTGCNLRGANLSGANLNGANLREANLSVANLGYADLTEADLRGADLSGASLYHADLTRAYLRDASLIDANLSGATLNDAALTSADFSGANLHKANLEPFRQDFIAEVLNMPAELGALRAAIVGGRINGSTYSGECSCLAGTLAKASGIDYYKGEDIDSFRASSLSPREIWFSMIKTDDTPENNQASRIALEWLDHAISVRNKIMALAGKF